MSNVRTKDTVRRANTLTFLFICCRFVVSTFPSCCVLAFQFIAIRRYRVFLYLSSSLNAVPAFTQMVSKTFRNIRPKPASILPVSIFERFICDAIANQSFQTVYYRCNEAHSRTAIYVPTHFFAEAFKKLHIIAQRPVVLTTITPSAHWKTLTSKWRNNADGKWCNLMLPLRLVRATAPGSKQQKLTHPSRHRSMYWKSA